MNGPLNSAGTGSFTSSLKAISESGKTSGSAVIDQQDTEFSDLIDQQNAIPGLLEELKGLLPEQDFSQIEAFVGGGNSLPPAADNGNQIELTLGLVPLPMAATLAVARQQFAAAQMAGNEPLPAPSESASLPTLAEATTIPASTVSGVGADALRTFHIGAALATSGFATELLKAEIDSVSRSQGSGLEESASAAQLNPLSVLKSAASMRAGSPAALTLDTPLTARGWEQGVGDRVMWMLGNSVQGASLRINPAHLGPIEIQISMQQDQATVTFNAQHAVVREALEASIPRLREMFQENNLQLANVDVGQRGNSEQRASDDGSGDDQEASSRDIFDRPGYGSSETDEPAVVQSAILGLLDDYA